MAKADTKIFYLVDNQGYLHSEPAVASLVIKERENIYSFYFSHGLLYRDESIGSAISFLSAGNKTFFYHSLFELKADTCLISEDKLKESLLSMNVWKLKLEMKAYLSNSHCHRDGGPAYIYEAKKVKEYIYYQRSKIHGEDGPARIHDAGARLESWHIEDLELEGAEVNV